MRTRGLRKKWGLGMAALFSLASLLVVCQYFCLQPPAKNIHISCHEPATVDGDQSPKKEEKSKACCKNHRAPFVKVASDDLSHLSKIIVSFVFTLPIDNLLAAETHSILHPAVHGPPHNTSQPIYILKQSFLI